MAPSVILPGTREFNFVINVGLDPEGFIVGMELEKLFTSAVRVLRWIGVEKAAKYNMFKL